MFLKIFIFVACLQFVVSKTYDKVNLTFAYQARCPYCMEFLNDQFYTGYKNLSDYINIELIPLVSRVRPLKCSHGENECLITKAHACVFDRPEVTEALRVEYFYCTEAKAIEGEDVVDSDIEACVNSTLANIVSYDTVKTCMDGDGYVKLLTDWEFKAKYIYKVRSVPWLAYFGVMKEKQGKKLRRNFVKAICKKLSNPPDVCVYKYLFTKRIAVTINDF